MPRLSLTFAAALVMSLCLAQSSAHAQTDEETPPAAADQPGAPIAAEEPEPPSPRSNLKRQIRAPMSPLSSRRKVLRCHLTKMPRCRLTEAMRCQRTKIASNNLTTPTNSRESRLRSTFGFVTKRTSGVLISPRRLVGSLPWAFFEHHVQSVIWAIAVMNRNGVADFRSADKAKPRWSVRRVPDGIWVKGFTLNDDSSFCFCRSLELPLARMGGERRGADRAWPDSWRFDSSPSTSVTLDLEPEDLEMALATIGTSLQQAVMIAIISSLTIDSGVQALPN